MTEDRGIIAVAPPLVWAIAGTDPSGGAGLPADIKTLHALGVYAAPVVTAVLAQSSRRVLAIRRMPATLICAQLEALRDESPPAAVKIGMLGGAPAVRVVAEILSSTPAPVVCDPVLVSSGGTPLLDAPGRREFERELLPRVTVLTPNLLEARRLTGLNASSAPEIPPLAERLLAMGPKAVIIKGGHLSSAFSADYYRDPHEAFWLVSPRLARTPHGTGCVFSSAIAAALAKGQGCAEAVRTAKAYVHAGIHRVHAFGQGRPVILHPATPEAQDIPQVYPDLSWIP